MTKALNELTITEAAKELRSHSFSVRELWDACASVARAKNSTLNAYLELFEADETAIAQAQKRIDTEGDSAPPLCGIPFAIKDNILIEGKTASAASRMLANYTATYDATVIKKLKKQQVLFVGRTNMDEFALGGSTENSAFGPTRNPHDTTRVAGGTSGGSACAVAANMTIGALGSDTGGSLRNPASYCGVIGLKPTFGSVSRSGLIPAVCSFDQIGPLARTVADARLMLEVIRGKDALDSTSIGFALEDDTKEIKRIGVPRQFIEGLSAELRAQFDATLKKLEGLGIAVVDIEIPLNKPALSAYYIINFAEVSTNLARLDGVRYGLAKRGDTLLDDYVMSRSEGFGAETKRRIMLGTYVLSAGYIDAYYRKADMVRGLLRKQYQDAFESVDVIATPTMPTPAFKIGEKSDPLSLYLEDIFTVTANLTGLPAISVPMGTVTKDGTMLPVGMQFTAPLRADNRLFKIGALVTGE